MSANETKFDWKATESAPKNYPMQIINGTLRYHDSSGEGLYVPNGGVISHGWGRMRSSHITGPDLKPLPDKLDITYFSFMEDTFYKGSFDLPYDKILKLFQQGLAKNKDDPTYTRIMVGVAPGGTIAVWLFGNEIKEVFFGQAQKVDMDFAKSVGMPDAKRAEYVKKVCAREATPEILTAIQKHGVPLKQWAQYRTQYHWVPTFAVSHPPKDFGMGFYNGESGRYNFPLEKVFTETTHPIPKEISFTYAINGEGKRYQYIIHFNEIEMHDAFNRLAANQRSLRLEFDPKFPKELTQARLRDDKEAIELRKFSVEKW